jgi:hypothetical protein
MAVRWQAGCALSVSSQKDHHQPKLPFLPLPEGMGLVGSIIGPKATASLNPLFTLLLFCSDSAQHRHVDALHTRRRPKETKSVRRCLELSTSRPAMSAFASDVTGKRDIKRAYSSIEDMPHLVLNSTFECFPLAGC